MAEPKVVIKPSGEWVLEGEDSRIRFAKADHQVMGRLGQFMDKVYCLSCGCDGGFALKSSLFLIYQCQECCDRYGSLPMPRMPEEDEVKWRNGRSD